MLTDEEMEYVYKVYQIIRTGLDQVLVGQNNVKNAFASALVCDTNSRLLLTGQTAAGKTTLAKFMANSFPSERISVTNDLLPSDIQNQLKNKKNMQVLQIDEFNRASGKVQSALIELLEEKQMTIEGEKYSFNDFYVFATQNSKDIAGIYTIPEAVCDRFDMYIEYDKLSDEEKRILLFGNFIPRKGMRFDYQNFKRSQEIIGRFPLKEEDERIMLQIFETIDALTLDEKPLFAGTNIRAHKYALKLAKLNAILYGGDCLLASDIVDYIPYLYKHRIDQNVIDLEDPIVTELFLNLEDEVLSIKRKKCIKRGR